MDEQKDLEKLMDKIFDVDQLDAPSADFTTNVLEKIEAQKKVRLTYAPLLPGWVFVIIAVLVVLFVLYVFSSTESVTLQTNYFESMDFSTNWLSERMSQFSFSKSLGYSILVVGVLICLQARLLNRFLYRTNSLT
ncbi:hypothetical protein L0P88_02150 [Muricauda sp. SCSIO 64092]|uniref:hypothetical protein n=1 Tax=Allomuricauda sp. SCSIO 64092 TaxID=2908842 RepID=UPI001FF5E426|nr:hypothetical protein [Muricauda sp. SCSIO 64092]UOY07368.1 hypothetical protein L0P88_02150 [Muricauda sp. SCSIO 64092]